MATTSNGKSWGHNTGHLIKWFSYGFALRAGVRAEQRRVERPGETTWVAAQNVATVGAMWFVHKALIILTAFYWLGTITWFLIARANNGLAGAAVVIFGVPAMIFQLVTLFTASGLFNQAQGLPISDRQVRAMTSRMAAPYRTRRSLLGMWLLMYLLPFAAYFPMHVSSVNLLHDKGGCAVPPCMVHQDYVPFAPGDNAVLLSPPPTNP